LMTMYYSNRQLTALAGELDALQSVENDGRGIVCVKEIVLRLRQGNQDGAMTVRQNESDKIRQYPAIEAFLLQKFGCRLHGIRECDKPSCQQ